MEVFSSSLFIDRKINVSMKMCRWNYFVKEPDKHEPAKLSVIGRCFGIVLSVLLGIDAYSQDGSAGITAATTNLVTYFAVGVTLMYAIGAVLGLVGAIKVYQKWSHGDHDTSKVAASWFGSCIFLVIVATVLKSFFGV
jgi:hypothetical protein